MIQFDFDEAPETLHRGKPSTTCVDRLTFVRRWTRTEITVEIRPKERKAICHDDALPFDNGASPVQRGCDMKPGLNSLTAKAWDDTTRQRHRLEPADATSLLKKNEILVNGLMLVTSSHPLKHAKKKPSPAEEYRN